MRRSLFVTGTLSLGVCVTTALGQDAAPVERSIWDLVQAGGVVGYAIIVLSLVGIALVVDAFIRLRPPTLVPPNLAESVLELARKGKFEEVMNLCKMNDSLLGRVVVLGLTDHKLGLEAVREGLQQQGVQEVTRLRQRNGYIGLIAAIAPMLGLLGTVTGMIGSFRLLGEAQGAARPDELALGISQALITTCMGLVLAVPLTFFYAFFRDRITRIGQDAGGVGEKMLRIMSYLVEKKQAARS